MKNRQKRKTGRKKANKRKIEGRKRRREEREE